MTRLCIVTGEASGDLHAASVLRELKKLEPELRSFGLGGTHLAAEGMEVVRDVRDLAVVGLFNVLRHLPMYQRVFAELMTRIERERPDGVLLVDFPDFNLRVARRCKALGIPVVYYISPQVWAWRKGRIHEIVRNVTHMIVIFPFEEAVYRTQGMPVTYVGHPLVEQLSGIERRVEDGTAPTSRKRIALMPGSRTLEVDLLLPPMLQAVRLLASEVPIEPFIIRAPTIDRQLITKAITQAGVDVPIVEGEGNTALARADLCFCSSGTATLEAAILGIPVIVVYRLSTLTYLLARRMVSVPHFSLVNIVAGRKVVPELLQSEVTGEAIAAEARRLFDPSVHARVREDLAEVSRRLGEPGASRRAAEKIYRLVGKAPEEKR